MLPQFDRKQACPHQYSRRDPGHCPLFSSSHCLLLDGCHTVDFFGLGSFIPSCFILVAFAKRNSPCSSSCLCTIVSPDFSVLIGCAGTAHGVSASTLVFARHTPATPIDFVFPISSTRTRPRKARLTPGCRASSSGERATRKRWARAFAPNK